MAAADLQSIRSNAHRAYRIVRERLIHCAYAPGQKLKIADLAAELDVSPGAMREALSRLTSEQLVEARDQQGFRAALISLPELEDLTATRVDIETMVLRRAMATNDGPGRDAIDRAHRQLIAAQTASAAVRSAAHGAFHAALVARCPSTTLLRIRAGLYEASERYRHFALQSQVAPRDVAGEHAALADAVLNGDVQRACEIAATHIRTTADFIRLAMGAEARAA